MNKTTRAAPNNAAGRGLHMSASDASNSKSGMLFLRSTVRSIWVKIHINSGGIQIFQEQVLSLQDSLTTGSLIITVSRGKPCWLSQYKYKVDLCVANSHKLAREIYWF